MDSLPTVGSVLVARHPRRLRWASVGRPVIEIPAGTRLEVTRLDGRWDHTHAEIVSTFRFTLHLKVLDGGSAGEIVTVTKVLSLQAERHISLARHRRQATVEAKVEQLRNLAGAVTATRHPLKLRELTPPRPVERCPSTESARAR